MSEEIRNRILGAAATVYAQYGFRGATTRLIAAEAGVNEVTLFRTFGSKAQLLQAMLHSQVESQEVPLLPQEPVDPHAELTRWCVAVLEHPTRNPARTHVAIARRIRPPSSKGPTAEGPGSRAVR